MIAKREKGKSDGLFFIRTFGCQMNAYDSEVIESMLENAGLQKTNDPAEADTIIVNTCSVRKHAEQRAFSWLHDLERFDASLVVCGCMAQRYGKKLKDDIPGVDIVCGPDNYKELVQIITDESELKVSAVLINKADEVTYSIVEGLEPSPKVSRFLSVTRGCDNFCAYCVVPYLRGKVRSKEPSRVISEINMMISNGAKEVTLLGQNVLAYLCDSIDFTNLVKMILDETDLPRLRFLTSHPRDVTEELFIIMAENERLCPHIHLPLQSGSSRILDLMGRGYTPEKYLSILKNAREIVPGLAVTTDIIVGFPSETESDFNDTLKLVEQARFDSAFTFKYSPRKGTPAFGMDDDVTMDKKNERLYLLNERIRQIRLEIHRNLLGRNFQILLDGQVKKHENKYFKGRTPHFRNVLVKPGRAGEGDILDVNLEELVGFTFIGK